MKDTTWPTCSILTITQVLEIYLESNQRQMKTNIHIYNFHEDTKTQFITKFWEFETTRKR